MKPFNTPEEYKSAIIASKFTAKKSVQIGSAASTHEQKQAAIDLIFASRNNQATLIDMAKRDYPDFNWHSLI